LSFPIFFIAETFFKCSGDFDRAAHEPESLKTIAKALEMGINFLDTAWIYQVGVQHFRFSQLSFSFYFSLLELAVEVTTLMKN
jgi:predicted aldo/keto reductase-like oxidoreductase